jgi:hypothetical protein
VELLPKFLNHHSPTWQEAVREELEMKEHKKAVAKTVLNLSLGEKSEVQKRWTEVSHGIINENNLRHAHARWHRHACINARVSLHFRSTASGIGSKGIISHSVIGISHVKCVLSQDLYQDLAPKRESLPRGGLQRLDAWESAASASRA